MTFQFVFGCDEELAQWCCAKVAWMDYSPGMRAVGVAESDDPAAKILAAVVYHNYVPAKMVQGKEWYNHVEVSFAASSPRFATRETIRSLLKVPFDQYKVRHVLVTIPSINERAMRFVKGIGFKPRGTLADYYSKGVHACVFGLHRNTFKGPTFLARKPRPPERRTVYGQEYAIGAASA